MRFSGGVPKIEIHQKWPNTIPDHLQRYSCLSAFKQTSDSFHHNHHSMHRPLVFMNICIEGKAPRPATEVRCMRRGASSEIDAQVDTCPTEERRRKENSHAPPAGTRFSATRPTAGPRRERCTAARGSAKTPDQPKEGKRESERESDEGTQPHTPHTSHNLCLAAQ